MLQAIATLAFASGALAASSGPSSTITAAAQLAASPTGSPLPLTEYTYAYSDVPYQVNPYPIGRGPQSGYNQCNSTTEGPDAMCQTIEMNSLADFCVWGSPTTNATGTIGDIEAAVVSYCTWAGHGGRIMPAGTITAAQFMVTSAYIQITGLLNQTGVNLAANDTGGELDPHGADLFGNPLGGLAYSTALPGGNNGTYVQAHNWNLFIGSDTFCFKMCYNNVTSPDYCQNKYDIIGCDYNMPASYTPNEFTSCEGELQDEVGTYTGSDGKTTVWSMPQSLGPSETLPWTPRIPASSNCQTYQSSDLYPASKLGYQSSASATTTSAKAGKTDGSTSGGRTTTAGQAMSTGGTNTASSANSKATGAASGLFVTSSMLFGAALGVAALLL